MELIECTISGLFKKAVESYGDRTAIVYDKDAYTWRELDVLSDRMAEFFLQKGIKPGDKVGLWSKNSSSWVVAFVALQKQGAVTALLNPVYTKRELKQAIKASGINYLAYGDTYVTDTETDFTNEIVKDASWKIQAAIDINGELPDLSVLADKAGKRTEPVISPYEEACLLFTTGTVFEPKCVSHDHYSLINNAISTSERAHFDETDRFCMSQPLFHVFPVCSGLLAAFYCGASLCVVSDFKSEVILKAVESYSCTVLNGVPTNFLRLLSNKNFTRYNIKSLRISIIGGADIQPSQLEYVKEAFPGVHIMRNYGLTEGCNLCNSEFEDSFETVCRGVGKPYPYIELSIKDIESGKILKPGEKGEVVVKGYSVMKGYVNNSPDNKMPDNIDADGWLHTGDIGVLDESGCLSIAGRLKDIIIRGGENINPIEVCKEIERYEPVLYALVIGSPHPVLGEEVIACIKLDSPEDYLEKELRALLSVRLSKYKIPAYFFIYDEFPMKPGGKIDMQKLRKDVYKKALSLHKGDSRYNISPAITSDKPKNGL